MSSFESKQGGPSGAASAGALTAAATGAGAVTGGRLPSAEILRHAARLAISEDKKIMMDYWVPSLEKKIIIGVRTNGESLLVKTADEFTSPIEKMFSPKSKTGEPGEDSIVITANSIYLVASNISRKRIT